MKEQSFWASTSGIAIVAVIIVLIPLLVGFMGYLFVNI